MTLLRADGIEKRFRQPDQDVVALHEVSLDIDSGDLVIVTGESGSGKSTLLSILGLMDRPSRGSVSFRGEAVESASAPKLASLRLRSMGFVFQDFLLVRHLSAADNVSLPIELAGGSRSDARGRAAELLDRVGLGRRAAHRPDALSRGEMQRVALARALANRPEIVLADEPTANLDRGNSDRVWSLLRDWNREEGLAVVVATHNRDRLADATRVVTLRDGKIVASDR